MESNNQFEDHNYSSRKIDGKIQIEDYQDPKNANQDENNFQERKDFSKSFEGQNEPQSMQKNINDDQCSSFFESLKNLNFQERINKIKILIQEKRQETFNLTELEDDLELFNTSVKRGYKKFNDLFGSLYKILYEDAKESFSNEDIKQIITGCIIFIQIQSKFSQEDQLNLICPKIFKEPYFNISKYQELINLDEDEDNEAQIAQVKKFFRKINQNKKLQVDELIDLIERENLLKNLQKFIEMIEGPNEAQIKILIFQTSQEFRIDQYFNYLKDTQSLLDNPDSQQKLSQIEEVKVSSYSQKIEFPNESQKFGQTPKNQNFKNQDTPNPAFKDEYLSSLIQLQNFQTSDESLYQILNDIKQQFVCIQNLIKNIKTENYEKSTQLCSIIEKIKNNKENFYDDEYIQLNLLIDQCAKDMKICSLFEKNIEIAKGLDEKSTFEFNSYDEFIEYMYENLMINSDDGNKEFQMQLNNTKYIQQKSNFQNQWKMLEACRQNVDQINLRFKKYFQILYEKNSINISHEQKEQIIFGCSLYILLENLLQPNIYQKINKPLQLEIQNKVIFQQQQQKIIEFRNLKVSQNQQIFQNIVELVDQIEQIKKNTKFNQQSNQDLQDNINLIEDYLQQFFEGEEQQQLLEMIKNIFAELDIQHQFSIQIISSQQIVEQEPMIVEITPSVYFDNEPEKYIEELIQNKNIKDPKDLEKKIIDKYTSNIDRQSLLKIKQLFNQIKEFKEEDQINENLNLSTTEIAQECLDHIIISENNQELYNLLIKYCLYKIPEINLKQQISRTEQIQIDFKEINYLLPIINDKYTISDFMTIYSRDKFESDQIEIQQEFQIYGKIDGQKLIFQLFDCIKRKIDFNQVIQIFTQMKSDFKITPTILFTYLYAHCDQELRLFLFISCSQHMALPISVLNPWEIDDQTQLPKRIYFEEIVYVFEKYNSVFQFKFLANINYQNVQNCSTILNKMLGKNFQTHQTSSANEGSIEIQFDNNCSTIQNFTVADSHGQLETEIILNISQLFDCLIIHTDKEHNKNQKLKDFLDQLNKSNKIFNLILIIVHNQNKNIQNGFESTKIDKNIVQIETPLIKKFNVNNILNFIDKCLIEFQNYFKNDQNQYLKFPEKRLENKKQYLIFLEQKVENNNILNHQKSLEILSNLIKIITKQDDFTSLDFLPMLQYSQQKHQYENIQKNESLNLKKQEIDDFDKKLKDLEDKMSKQNLSKLSQTFLEVVYNDLQLQILPILSLYIKGFLQTIRDPYEDQISKLQEKISQSNQQQRPELENQIKNLKKILDKKIFSQEHLIREIYEFSVISKQNDQKQQQKQLKINFKEAQMRLTSQLIRDCQPLELINGDTNQFISNIYEELIFGNEKEEVMVISVIGVQSAGKSLLLNFLFGTQFHSSAARCTKGVYGTIIQFVAENGLRKKILLLDTEGIQSTEKQDPQFDRKIVYFILSVSHVILLCNKQEMNQDMGEILKLVADQLVNAKQRNVHSPKIFIILNMLNQSSHQIKIECVKKLQKELAIIDKNKDNESQNQTLQINVSNVFPLQFAFKKDNFKIYF